MIEEDKEWLRKVANIAGDINEGPASELGHIIDCLNDSVKYYYDCGGTLKRWTADELAEKVKLLEIALYDNKERKALYDIAIDMANALIYLSNYRDRASYEGGSPESIYDKALKEAKELTGYEEPQ
jgi:hypothetical protein